MNELQTKTVDSTEIQMIESIAALASSPNVDPEKLDKLLDIQIKMMDRRAEMLFNEALARIQAQVPRVAENGKIKNKDHKVTSTYMKYEDIDKAIRPLLQQEGFSLLHDRTEKDGKMIVKTTLKHSQGHSESVSIPLPYDQPNGLKNAVQAAVSTFSYGKRVNVCSLLNIVAEGEDDDGQKSQAFAISEGQSGQIKEALQHLFEIGKEIDTSKFIKYFGVNSVDEIPASRFSEAMDMIKRREKK